MSVLVALGAGASAWLTLRGLGSLMDWANARWPIETDE